MVIRLQKKNEDKLLQNWNLKNTQGSICRKTALASFFRSMFWMTKIDIIIKAYFKVYENIECKGWEIKWKDDYFVLIFKWNDPVEYCEERHDIDF